MNQAFMKVEAYLLPLPESRLPSSSAGKNDLNFTPQHRLDQTLFQVALADHIRSMQTMYRDTHDEQSLVNELRSGNSGIKLPIKHLLEKIVEGRARSIALLNMCYGRDSIEVLRGTLDLASSYALQGMWPQVNEKLQRAQSLFDYLGTDAAIATHELRRRKGVDAAKRICCVFRVLREHAMKSNGQLRKLVAKQMLLELTKVPAHNPLDDEDPLHPSALTAQLHTFFVSLPPQPAPPKDRQAIKALSHSYFPQDTGAPSLAVLGGAPANPPPTTPTTEAPPLDLTKSWGEVVDFLRRQCPVMRAWVADVEASLQPQSKAALALPFRQCDPLHRNVAHPVQLSHFIVRYPTTAKLLSGTKLAKQLTQIPVQVPLSVDLNTGDLVDNPPPGVLTGAQQAKLNFLNQSRNIQNLFYELPMTREEFLSLYVVESDDSIPLEVMKVQALTLQGICHIYLSQAEEAAAAAAGGGGGGGGGASPTNHGSAFPHNHNPHSPIPASAEDSLTRALNILESCGLEMTVAACELYNSIAQLMIMKQRQWVASRKLRIKEALEAWIVSDEGRREIKIQSRAIKKQFTDKNLLMSGAEVELRAKNHVMKKRIRHLSSQEENKDEMNRALEAAYRYLVRLFEILEDTHGPMHPSVSTACLAVASVENILGKFEDTREWLVRGLRYMEKQIPVPIRAITFTQTQLAQVLSKLGHDDEARRVLAKAASFHIQQAQAGIAIHNNYHTYHINIIPPPAEVRPPDSARSNASSMHGEHPDAVAAAPTGEKKKGGGGDDHTSVAAPNPLLAAANFIPPPILKGTILHDEIDQAIDLTNRAIKMNAKSGDKWPAAQLAEELALLMESAFGWDSLQAAEAFKHVGIRCAAVSDWARSVKYLKLAAEAHDTLFGKRDPRTQSVAKILASVRKSRSGGGPAIALPQLDGEGENGLNVTDDDIAGGLASPGAEPIPLEKQLYTFPEGGEEEDPAFVGGSGGAMSGGVGVTRVISIDPDDHGIQDPTSPLSSHSGGSPGLSGINLVRAMAKSTAVSQLQQN